MLNYKQLKNYNTKKELEDNFIKKIKLKNGTHVWI